MTACLIRALTFFATSQVLAAAIRAQSHGLKGDSRSFCVSLGSAFSLVLRVSLSISRCASLAPSSRRCCALGTYSSTRSPLVTTTTMRLITFLLTTALVALVAASSSSSATDPVRFQRIVKRGVIKGLVVANPTEAKVRALARSPRIDLTFAQAWKKYRKHFKVQINYSTDVSKGAKVSGVSYAPMRRRGQSRSRFRKEAIASIKAGARYLLHYNERASLELAELTDELAITASRARKAPRIGRK